MLLDYKKLTHFAIMVQNDNKIGHPMTSKVTFELSGGIRMAKTVYVIVGHLNKKLKIL